MRTINLGAEGFAGYVGQNEAVKLRFPPDWQEATFKLPDGTTHGPYAIEDNELVLPQSVLSQLGTLRLVGGVVYEFKIVHNLVDGDTGIKPPGEDIPDTYVHNQVMAANTWTIDHTLNKYPSVSIIDSAGTKVEGDITYVSKSRIQISFSVEFSGMAVLN